MTMDAFEQRLAAEFERYVAGATDPKPAHEIADAAMKPRGMVARARSSRNGGRLLLLGIAAVLAASAAVVGALRLTTRQDDTTLPKPTLLAVAPTPAPTPDPTVISTAPPPTELTHAIMLRDSSGGPAGVDVYELRPDGSERLVRNIPDSIFPAGVIASDYATVRNDGWIALANQQNPWPMAVVDLADPQVDPLIVNEASTGGVGMHWGPTGTLVALGHGPLGEGGNASNLIFVDPDARTIDTRTIAGALIGGGPSIIWTADGGILTESASGTFSTAHVDGSPNTPGFPELYEPGRVVGPDNTTVTVCEASDTCAAGQLGQVRLFQPNGSSSLIYQPAAGDRVVGATNGLQSGEYWLLVALRGGHEDQLLHLVDSVVTPVATIDVSPSWQSVYLRGPSPKDDLVSMMVDLGGVFGAILVDTATGGWSYTDGAFVGYVDAEALAQASPADFQPIVEAVRSPEPNQPIYVLPTVDQLIASEEALNPGRVLWGKGSRDAVAGDTAVQDYTFTVDSPGGMTEIYVDCLGAAPATVEVNGKTIEHPCLRSGSYIDMAEISEHETVTVHATGDTTWRVAIYSSFTEVGPGATPAPVPEPAS
jgi:hypothetical protein